LTEQERGSPGYCAHDLAQYPLVNPGTPQAAVPQTLVQHLEWPGGGGELRVAEAIAQTSAVGYGGHLDEVLEDDREGEVLRALADHLAPTYGLTWQRAYDLLLQVRDEHSARLRQAIAEAEERWRREGHVVERRLDADSCPMCRRRIADTDEEGCEAPDGQRWCVAHALDALVAYRPRPGRGRP
jgi:hypothetical protein